MKLVTNTVSALLLASCIVAPSMGFANSRTVNGHCPKPQAIQLVENGAQPGQYAFMSMDIGAMGMYVSVHMVNDPSVKVTRFNSARIIGVSAIKDISPTQCSYTISNGAIIHMYAMGTSAMLETFQPSGLNWQQSGQGMMCTASDSSQCVWKISSRPMASIH